MEENRPETKILCAVSNPKQPKDKSWFCNIFMGRLKNIVHKPTYNEIKVNWLMTLSDEEIDKLEQRNCKVIKLTEEIEITMDSNENSEFKSGFKVLFDLFEKAMSNNGIKKEIKNFLTNKDGKPSKDYETIMKTKKLLEE